MRKEVQEETQAGVLQWLKNIAKRRCHQKIFLLLIMEAALVRSLLGAQDQPHCPRPRKLRVAIGRLVAKKVPPTRQSPMQRAARQMKRMAGVFFHSDRYRQGHAPGGTGATMKVLALESALN